jgi:hypothetical protein
VFKSLLFANVFVELMYKILKMSDHELDALLAEYENDAKPKQLTEEELAAQLAALQAEFDAEHPTTPRTPIMSDADFEAALKEYEGGKTRRHKKRTHKKKKSMYKKKRTCMNKKKRANKKGATRRRRH